MQLPKDEAGTLRKWTFEKENEGLLYFVQLIQEVLYYGAAEPFTVVSLDTYHRLRELERAWQESSAAGLAHATLTEVVEELVAFVSRDPVIKRNFSVEWEAIQPRLNSFNDRPREAIEASLLQGISERAGNSSSILLMQES